MEIEKVKEGLHICTTEGSDCTRCSYHEYGYPHSCHFSLTKDALTTIEELMAQVKDKEYLIQQQADEIERLRRDVKKQQEKMFELAKRLPHWVSCEERLPEVGELVVIIDDDGHANTATLSAMGGWWLSNSNDFFQMSRILYWMPLPQPPREVQE